MVFQKGMIPWNKGGKFSEESKRKMSESSKGVVGFWKGKKRPEASEWMNEARLRLGIVSNFKHGLSRTTEYRKALHRKWFEENKEHKYFQNHQRKMLKKSGATHTRKEWMDLKEKFDNKCLRCGKKEPDIKLTEDHIVPLSLGGKDIIDNIQPLCLKCNISKHMKSIDYRQLLIQEGGEKS